MTSTPLDSAPPQRTFASLVVVYMTVFLDLLGFGLILPLRRRLRGFAVMTGITAGVAVGILLALHCLDSDRGLYRINR